MWTTRATLRGCASVAIVTAALLTPAPTGASQPSGPALTWSTVVDSSDPIPGVPGYVRFNSFNQPSVNADGVVVFRARSRGPQPVHGIYLRDMALGTDPSMVMDRSTAVPQPNNEGMLFTEFPSFPRIDLSSTAVVSRGQSPPLWRYILADGSESVIGTSGIYTTAGGSLQTGMSTVGPLPGFAEFAVPDLTPAARFEVFPSAPAITDGTLLVFKGNYTEGGVKKTGAYFRDLAAPDAPAIRLAATGTPIPGSRRRSAMIGEVGPPSAAARSAVFVAWDDEQQPTAGGIYLTPLVAAPKPRTLVSIGSQVPGEAKGVTFRQLGDGLAFDGRYVAFWGSWGSDTRDVTLSCPDEGNAVRLAYCLEHDDGAVRAVPVHQGVFVYDTRTERSTRVASTGADILDFQYWGYSGHPPTAGEGGEEGHEPPAWRSSTFVAVSASPLGFQVAYKGATPSGADRLYLASGPGRSRAPLALLETGTTPASTFDPAAPEGSVVTSIGIEREGFRNGWLAVTASMSAPTTTSDEGTAGVYVARVR